jgi:hypothetical protein
VTTWAIILTSAWRSLLWAKSPVFIFPRALSPLPGNLSWQNWINVCVMSRREILWLLAGGLLSTKDYNQASFKFLCIFYCHARHYFGLRTRRNSSCSEFLFRHSFFTCLSFISTDGFQLRDEYELVILSFPSGYYIHLAHDAKRFECEKQGPFLSRCHIICCLLPTCAQNLSRQAFDIWNDFPYS